MELPAYLTSLWRLSREHRLTSHLFLRGMGLIYALAFLSLGSQVLGLFGSGGIIPMAQLITNPSWSSFFSTPSAFWLGAPDWALLSVCGLGFFSGLGLLFGFRPFWSALLAFVGYCSFVNLGPIFLSFQWDILLLEVGLLAILLAPDRPYTLQNSVPYAGFFYGRLILAKLLLSSCLVKLLSGDPLWASGTALVTHLSSQPLPHIGAYWAQQLPDWILKIGSYGTLVLEGTLPFFFFGALSHRKLAFGGTCLLMIGIALTGNYGFFNLLTIVLAILLLEDEAFTTPKLGFRFVHTKQNVVRASLFLVLSFVTIHDGMSNFMKGYDFQFSRSIPLLSHLHVTHSYGLFARMTTTRYELEIQGSLDGQVWEAYIPKFKPYRADVAPKWVWPHQPRLDWQLWFAALGPYESSVWLDNLLFRLSTQSPDVERLFQSVPFKDSKPRYLRIVKRHFWLDSSGTVLHWWNVGSQQRFSPIFQVGP